MVHLNSLKSRGGQGCRPEDRSKEIPERKHPPTKNVKTFGWETFAFAEDKILFRYGIRHVEVSKHCIKYTECCVAVIITNRRVAWNPLRRTKIESYSIRFTCVSESDLAKVKRKAFVVWSALPAEHGSTGYMDAAAELGRNPVSKHQIHLEYGDEQADAGRDCRTRLSRPISQARTRSGKCSFSLFS